MPHLKVSPVDLVGDHSCQITVHQTPTDVRFWPQASRTNLCGHVLDLDVRRSRVNLRQLVVKDEFFQQQQSQQSIMAAIYYCRVTG